MVMTPTTVNAQFYQLIVVEPNLPVIPLPTMEQTTT